MHSSVQGPALINECRVGAPLLPNPADLAQVQGVLPSFSACSLSRSLPCLRVQLKTNCNEIGFPDAPIFSGRAGFECNDLSSAMAKVPLGFALSACKGGHPSGYLLETLPAGHCRPHPKEGKLTDGWDLLSGEHAEHGRHIGAQGGWMPAGSLSQG